MPVSEAKQEKKRKRDSERKRKKAEELGLDPEAKKLEIEMPLPPALEAENEEEYTVSIKMASALYEACVELKNSKCTVSMMGSHYRVHAIKKGDERMKQYRLVEVIKRHTDMFEVEQDGEQSAQWPVKLLPDAKENLAKLQKKAGIQSLEEEEAQEGLPDFEMPTDHAGGLHAVRVECVRSLKRRGAPTALHDMCQDRALLKLKLCFNGDRVIESIMSLFPDNFSIETKGTDGHKEVTLLSEDVDDLDILDELVAKKGREYPIWKGEDAGGKGAPRKKGGGGGKGGGKMSGKMWDAMTQKGLAMLMMKGMKGKGKGKGWW